MDYYVFASDHLTFCLGDTFAILGTLCFLNCKTTALRITLPIALFVLSLASYQPKIALIGMLSLLVIPLSWLNKSALKEKGVLSLFAVLKEALQVLFISTSSVTIYWLSSKIIITHTVEARTYFNTNRESFNIIVNSYSRFLEYYTTHLGGIPPALSYIPLVIIFCGILYIFLSIYRVSLIGSLIFLLLASMLPIALYSSYVINKNTWNNAGRILSANGYLFVIMGGLLLRLQSKPLLMVASTSLGLILYFFSILATQQTNAAQLKSIQELNMINRFTVQLEKYAAAGNRSLLVVGDPPSFPLRQYVKHPPRFNTAHVFTPTFVNYRQIEMINFMLGKGVFHNPSMAQVTSAIPLLESKKPWPSPECIFQINDMVVLLLEKYKPGIRMTLASDKK